MASGTIKPSYDIYNTWALHFANSMTGVFIPESPVSYAYALNQYGGAFVADAMLYFDPPEPPAGEGYYAFVVNASLPNANNTYAQILNSSGAALSGPTPRGGTGTAQWTLPRVMTKAEWLSYGMRVRLFNDTGYPHPGQYIYPGQLSLSWFTTAFPATGGNSSLATNITTVSATVNGSVSPNGYPIEYWFEWGTTTSYGNQTAAGNTSSNGNVSSNLSGLAPGTTYHFRLAVKNLSSGITTYGSDQEFTTQRGLAAVI